MQTEIDVDGRRAEAKRYRGVSYDARIDRFTAEIYIGGTRRWLGSFDRAADAGDAYRQAAAEREAVAPRRSSYNQVYAAFRERHGGDRTEPPVGAVLEYDGQSYRFAGLDWRKPGGGKSRAFYIWESRCKTCGAPFRTRTPAPVSVANGISRNCSEHATRKRSKARAKAEGSSEPLAMGRYVAVVDVLGMVFDSIPIDEAVAVVAGEFALDEKAAMIALMDDVVSFREAERPMSWRFERGRVVFL